MSCYLKSLFSAELMEEEHKIWRKAMEERAPSFYEGTLAFKSSFRARFSSDFITFGYILGHIRHGIWWKVPDFAWHLHVFFTTCWLQLGAVGLAKDVAQAWRSC